MCGIVLAMKKSGEVKKSLIKRYRNQAHRGKSGYAFLSLKTDPKTGNNKIDGIHRRMHEKDILKDLQDNLSNFIMFHHRLPTSTVNIPCATHPIAVENDTLKHNYYVVHNGVLTNEDSLKKTHEGLGFKYTTVITNTTTHTGLDGRQYVSESKETFNDSEALAIDLALFIEGKSTALDSAGSIAFVCLQTDKEGNALNLFYGRNEGNPLICENNGDLFCLKSEGHGTLVPSGALYKRDLKTGETIYSLVDIGTYYKKTTTPYPITSWYDKGYGAYQKDYNTESYLANYQRCDDGIWRHKDALPLPLSQEDKAGGDWADRDNQLIDLYEELYFNEDQQEETKAEIKNNPSDEASEYLDRLFLEHENLTQHILALETQEDRLIRV